MTDESRFDRIDARLDQIETDVAVLKADVAVLKVDVAGLTTDGRGLRETVERNHHEMHVLYEATRDDIRLLAEAIVTLGERMDRGFASLRAEFAVRFEPIEMMLREHSRTPGDHERRIGHIEAGGGG